MNQETINELQKIATTEEKDPYFEIGNETGDILRLNFHGYVEGSLLYKIMEVVHIDGFFHRGGKTIMEVEEKEDDF